MLLLRLALLFILCFDVGIVVADEADPNQQQKILQLADQIADFLHSKLSQSPSEDSGMSLLPQFHAFQENYRNRLTSHTPYKNWLTIGERAGETTFLGVFFGAIAGATTAFDGPMGQTGKPVLGTVFFLSGALGPYALKLLFTTPELVLDLRDRYRIIREQNRLEEIFWRRLRARSILVPEEKSERLPWLESVLDGAVLESYFAVSKAAFNKEKNRFARELSRLERLYEMDSILSFKAIELRRIKKQIEHLGTGPKAVAQFRAFKDEVRRLVLDAEIQNWNISASQIFESRFEQSIPEVIRGNLEVAQNKIEASSSVPETATFISKAPSRKDIYSNRSEVFNKLLAEIKMIGSELPELGESVSEFDRKIANLRLAKNILSIKDRIPKEIPNTHDENFEKSILESHLRAALKRLYSEKRIVLLENGAMGAMEFYDPLLVDILKSNSSEFVHLNS